jgi:alkylhydroperoxidase/carboxymuconolactone decarboxylase family protein YurZ
MSHGSTDLDDADRRQVRWNQDMTGPNETLARIAVRDDRFIASLPTAEAEAELDLSTCALVRLAALIGLDGSPASFVASVHDAKMAGASAAEIVATLTTVLPSVGAVRASSAAPKIARALGYEPDIALAENRPEDEQINPRHRPR